MAGRGEIVEMLAKALARGRRSANDRGIDGRLRDVGQTFVDDANPGYARTDTFPERLWQTNNEFGVARTHGYGLSEDTANKNLTWEAQEYLEQMNPMERAVFFAERGLSSELTPYERMLLRSADPKDAARMTWGVDEPVAKSLLIGGAGIGGGALTLREALRNQYGMA